MAQPLVGYGSDASIPFTKLCGGDKLCQPVPTIADPAPLPVPVVRTNRVGSDIMHPDAVDRGTRTMRLNDEITRTRTEPPVTLDAALVERLQGMAMAIMERTPEVAERLLQEIDRSQLAPSGEVPPDVVTIGSRVTFIDNSTRQEQTVTVVFPPDADIAERRISVLTPIGAALIGLGSGASISWETRTGQTRELTVADVSPPTSVQA